MNHPSRATSVALALLAVASLPACSVLPGFGPEKQSAGLKSAGDLVGQVGRVHVDCELARENVQSALAGLRALVAGEFKSDAETTYVEFVGSIDRCEDVGRQLRGSERDMHAAAEPYFQNWSADLNSFANPAMRQRSQERLIASRQRFDAVNAALGPAREDLEAFSLGMRDFALFLEHDFNAVRDLEGEARTLSNLAVKLDERLEATIVAAREFVQSSALPVDVQVAPENVRPAERAQQPTR